MTALLVALALRVAAAVEAEEARPEQAADLQQLTELAETDYGMCEGRP